MGKWPRPGCADIDVCTVHCALCRSADANTGIKGRHTTQALNTDSDMEYFVESTLESTKYVCVHRMSIAVYLQSPVSSLQSPVSSLQSPVSSLQSPVSSLQSPADTDQTQTRHRHRHGHKTTTHPGYGTFFLSFLCFPEPSSECIIHVNTGIWGMVAALTKGKYYRDFAVKSIFDVTTLPTSTQIHTVPSHSCHELSLMENESICLPGL
jgi:hypothetical protein